MENPCCRYAAGAATSTSMNVEASNAIVADVVPQVCRAAPPPPRNRR
jgi:hypothetical protein